jgi:hypothetical protein
MATAIQNVCESWNAAEYSRRQKNKALGGAAKNRKALLDWLALPERVRLQVPKPMLGGLIPAWLDVVDGDFKPSTRFVISENGKKTG